MNKVASRALCRVGNQMFSIAAAATYANRTGKEFIGAVQLEKTQSATNFHKNSSHVLQTIFRNVKWLSYNDVKDFIIYPKIGNEGESQKDDFQFPEMDMDVVLNANFQDIRYIDKDVALKLFKPYDSIKNEIRELYGDLSDYVCVHVRRGDYLLLKGWFHVLSPNEINNILDKYFPDCNVLFVSDDINWCKENFHGKRYCFADKPCKDSVEMDLYIQTQCGKGNVMSNSTFSWWGAYLNEKEDRKVVCPWPWFDNGDPYCRNILPEDWIKYDKKLN